ncbi:MAG: mandelate racemase/muconate lactonizing enzyme family protein [Planctomycetaceae bacterium]
MTSPTLRSADLSRRDLLKAGALWALSSRLPALQARDRAGHAGDRLRVTAIEPHEISVPYVDFQAYELGHFYGPTRRVVYVVRTNSELVGLGEGHSLEAESVREKYVGSNPFDWVGDETSLGLGMAMYDLMGQAAGVPVYKLFGQRHRAWIPVACWTVSTHPKRMAKAVQEFSARGYTWLKYHLSPFENVLDQMRAMQEVAPPGFKIHHDLTMGGSDDHVFELLEKISAFDIAGGFEDPLPEKDIAGYAELRQKCRLPIYYHHAPLGASLETLQRAADGYILGHSPIGQTMRRAGLFAQLELPFSLQNVGGNITRAFTTHMQAAFKTAWLHFNSDTESWSDDVVRERLNPVRGLIRVSEKPGLGVTLDAEALNRLEHLNLPEQPKWILRSTYQSAGGPVRMDNLVDPKDSLFLVRPDKRRLVTLGYADPIATDWWDPDGTPEFQARFRRLETEGMVLEPAS